MPYRNGVLVRYVGVKVDAWSVVLPEGGLVSANRVETLAARRASGDCRIGVKLSRAKAMDYLRWTRISSVEEEMKDTTHCPVEFIIPLIEVLAIAIADFL